MSDPKHELSHFTKVDSADDPKRFIQQLDYSTRMPFHQEVRRRMAAALHLKEGLRILDAGCGTGDPTRRLAEQVGPTGKVVGIDPSQTLIDEATRRAKEQGLKIDFSVGSIYELPFADNSFDGVQAEKVIAHLKTPHKGLSEMVRVTKPGGYVSIFDLDADSMIINVPNQLAATRKVVHMLTDGLGCGYIGRILPGIMHDLGLEDVQLQPMALMITDPKFADEYWHFKDMAQRAVSTNILTESEAKAWLASLDEASAKQGHFICSLQTWVFSGRKKA